MTKQKLTFFKRLRRKIGKAFGDTTDYDDPFYFDYEEKWSWRSLLPPYTGGFRSNAFLGVKIFGNRYENKRWFRMTFAAGYAGLRKIDRAYDWCRYRFVRSQQYHIVRTSLAPGYYDIDYVMFDACFTLLGRFVERELGPMTGDCYEGYDNLYRGYRLHSAGGNDEKAIDLWLWYKHELPEIERLYAEDLRACYGNDSMEFGEPDAKGLRELKIRRKKEPAYPYEWPEIEKDKKLRELIDMRRYLWT